MRHISKYNPFTPPDSGLIVPEMLMQICETDCPCCHKRIRFPVPHEYVDWKVEHNKMRDILEKTFNRFEQIITDVGIMAGDDNTIEQYIENEWEAFRQQINGEFR